MVELLVLVLLELLVRSFQELVVVEGVDHVPRSPRRVLRLVRLGWLRSVLRDCEDDTPAPTQDKRLARMRQLLYVLRHGEALVIRMVLAMASDAYAALPSHGDGTRRRPRDPFSIRLLLKLARAAFDVLGDVVHLGKRRDEGGGEVFCGRVAQLPFLFRCPG